MRVVVDATAANDPIRTGVGTYAFEVLSRLKNFAAPSDEIILATPTPLGTHWEELSAPLKSLVLPWNAPGWRTFRFASTLLRFPYDVLFLPSSSPPFGTPSIRSRKHHIVTTIHDVGFLRLPNLYERHDLSRQRRALKQQIRKAQRILCVSETTKRDLLELRHLKEDRLVVTPLGSLLSPASIAEQERVRRTYRLGRHFFLFVSRLDRKKNVEMLIHAFEMFKGTRGMGDPYELVLAGPDGLDATAIKRRVATSPVHAQIHVLGPISEADKAPLYGAALACVNLSWYEGFGLSALEAASCCTPSILSDISAHREVMGTAALYVSPEAAEQIMHTMKKMADEPREREALGKVALERAKQFSWDTTAKKTWEVLLGTLAGSSIFYE